MEKKRKKAKVDQSKKKQRSLNQPPKEKEESKWQEFLRRHSKVEEKK